MQPDRPALLATVAYALVTGTGIVGTALLADHLLDGLPALVETGIQTVLLFALVGVAVVTADPVLRRVRREGSKR